MPKNILFDSFVKPVEFNKLGRLKDIEIKLLDLDSREYEKWVLSFFPQYENIFGEIKNKKLIEFFITYSLLNITKDDVYVDVAGGQHTYVKKLQCKKKYLQDFIITEKIKEGIGNDVFYLEGNASCIDLKTASVTKISMHHSFEHFQENSDILFIKEIQRLLDVNGRCCIVPIFISNKYVELTDKLTFKRKFDLKSIRIIDPTATIAGGDSCGNYARIYDLESFQCRIIDQIDHSMFSLTLYEIKMDGKPVPDLKLKYHCGVSKINSHYRALLIEKKD